MLHSIAICVMVGNAESERVFSTVNRIKTALRTHLGDKVLERLVRISHSQITREEVDLDGAVDGFLAMRNRRLV